MDSVDKDILSYMSRRDNYNELKDVITKGLCVKESWELLTDFGVYFDEHPTVEKIDGDFILWQRIKRHPEWKPEVAKIKSLICQGVLAATVPDSNSFISTINHLKSTEFYRSIADDMTAGRITVGDADAKVRALSKRMSIAPSVVYSTTLNDIASQQRTGGYYWRLEDLNKSIGPLRKGDFVIVAKRPEVGGTSFLVSELSHMLEQTNGNSAIFNNEEAPEKVFSRILSAALGVSYRTLLGDTAKYQAEYQKWLGTKSFDLIHDTNMTLGSIKRQLEGKPYDLIGINVLLKVGGTDKQEDHDKLQELGENCRILANDYGPVVAIVQADPSAEGMDYIPMDRIYKSKTALQGEADALIMIGTGDPSLPGASERRHIHVAKNKLPPAACTDTTMKHLKSEVKFDMDTGRFSSKNFIGNSRNQI